MGSNTLEDRLNIQKDLDRLEHCALSNKMQFSGRKSKAGETRLHQQGDSIKITGSDSTILYHTEVAHGVLCLVLVTTIQKRH